MFLISIEYKVSFDKIEPYLDGHISFVRKFVDAGIFVLTAKKIPRTGGVILAKAESREELMKILSEDPFMAFDLAKSDISEIQLSQVSPQLLE